MKENGVPYEFLGHSVTLLVEALRYKPESLAGLIPDDIIWIFH
jgi:hypothetical protein